MRSAVSQTDAEFVQLKKGFRELLCAETEQQGDYREWQRRTSGVRREQERR